MEGITGSILLLCLIGLTNANTAPAIQTFLYSLCEDIPVGGYAFTINARDAEGDALTYTLTGPNAVYFTVGRNTGVVTVNRALDRESGDLMELDVAVSDGPNNTPGQLNLVLLEANDNKPIFQESSYDVQIPENTRVDTSLFRVQATDADTGTAGVVQYSIDEVTPNEGFRLFSIVSTTGEVKLKGSLNYTALSTFYRLKINATDGGGQCHFNENKFFSSIAFSFITVVDVPDLDPQFINVPYVARVAEDSAVNFSVFKVTAIDQDTGVNDEIIYSIEDSTEVGLFGISGHGGVISVLSAIDREIIGDTVTLTVKATESKPNIHGLQATATAAVLININDINDNKPEFYKCGESGDCVRNTHFTGEVLEHSLGSVPINMTVKDPDKISKTKLSLEGADKDVFSVEPQFTTSDSIVQLLVKQPQKLDFEEKQQMVLRVVAIDEENPSFQSTATVTININDTNDNSPTFPEDTYKLNVTEHSDVGTEVARITAEDPDTMDQGFITYRLLPDSILPYFDVQPTTGIIYVKNKSLLDREVRSVYSATLLAKDKDEKPGSTVLEITVTDINDQHPVINRESYLVFVEEGGQFEVKIEATDADDPDTANSQIVYGIMPSMYSGNFTIDPNTGVLRNNGILDREALDPLLNGRIELNITATDKGDTPLSTVVPVFITVEDINDNMPHFEASSYKFSVKEGEKGAYVGCVFAEDLDQTTDFNRISFSIIDGSFGSFIIRTFADKKGYRGNITVDPDIELDYESTRKQFNLRVEATDLEQKKAEVTVVVDVVDRNDERPEFKPTGPVTVKENTNNSEAIGRFTGVDKDGNHSLVYELESLKCRCNGSLTSCSWFILDPSGEVRVNPEDTVDYEQCDQALMEARVVDEYTEKGENSSITTAQLVINIEDMNDNTPEFIPSDSVFVVVSEGASKGTSVAGVTATDADSGVNRQIDFKVTGVKFQDTSNHTNEMRMLFEAVTTQQKDIYVGIIQTTEGLEMSLKGKYLVTVTATDTGGLSSSTVLEIFTVDETYKVELQFTKSVADVEQSRDTIIRSLTAATKAAVEVVAIKADTAETSRASDITIMVAYFVYSNGTALTSNDVEKMVSDPEHYPVLADLGLMYIGKAAVVEPNVDPLNYILLGMVGGLIIVLAVLTTSLLCTRRKYRRKLKAAKAMNSASMVTSDNQKSGPVVPGTNKYTMEGANPVLNLNIDTAMVLDLDEEDSDVDKVSLNSLDYSDEMIMSGKGTNLNMQMIQEEEEDDSRPPEYIEPLGAALAQRGQKKENPLMGFSNPAFSTTDL
ncbi:cadherin-related family member 2 [Seriola lalandi dorsalis]|uniref:Cadherin domain-containing protein n=1 Tax=Seriola lalandi dorsalis TaxID=1841481 RepID=A0A3B4WLP1_SERLL|nr:cadherin-related family member 2 [Seriola lalandi dorsalis]XP_056239733.1 cadherin-related family member 2 [Seriola aureovittata]